jgi:ParB-like chromosome segregation protein Spo0J
MRFKDLIPNPKNPRTVSDAKLAQLKKALKEFGNLDGFVFNKKTGHLISGHQRLKIFKEATIKGDWVYWNGERWPYREVNWSEAKEKVKRKPAAQGKAQGKAQGNGQPKSKATA